MQVVHELAFTVNYNDAGIATGVKKGTLPAGAIIIGTDVMIATAFNAATTNVLTTGGNSSTYDDIVAAADVAEGSIALTQNIKPTGSSLGKLAADRDVYAMYTQTGTAASAGKAYVIIKFIANNEALG
jgi:hypothetical protein